MTRRDFLVAAGAVLAVPRAPIHLRPALSSSKLRSKGPAPSPPQLAWQRDELAIFVHFGVNTFTDREWGDGKEDPAIFAPGALDARQWARAARAGGFRAVILTAKHHDGFCLWPTRTTEHSVRRSPFRAGGGDVVREFVDACRAEGLRPVRLRRWELEPGARSSRVGCSSASWPVLPPPTIVAVTSSLPCRLASSIGNVTVER